MVAALVRGQEHEVGVVCWRVGWPLAALASPICEVGLEAQNRSDLLLPGLSVERHGAVEVTVIGDGQRVSPLLLDRGDEIANPIGAVEEGVFAMRVKMGKGHE